MMFGGIPYYLNLIARDKPFIHAINDAAFSKDSIFLEEIDEILSIEFNSQGRESVKSILSFLGQDGTSQASIVKKSGIAQSTVSDIIEKLLDYKIIFPKSPAHKTQVSRGTKYHMKDFYLNFYYQVLEPLEKRIKRNSKGLLFSEACISSNSGYYIPNFSGKAFELLVRYILENSVNFTEKIFHTLLIANPNYRVLDYWDKTCQIDLLVESKDDRLFTNH